MADSQVDVKNLIEKITSNRLLFLYAFILMLAIFGLYHYILKNQVKDELDMIQQRDASYSNFESNINGLRHLANNAYINALQYHLEQRELYRYQAVSAIGDANGAFNDMYQFIQQHERSLSPKLNDLHQQLKSFEEQLLQKLNTDGTIPDLEFEPLIIGEDTAVIDFSVNTAGLGNERFTSENKQLRTLESSLFELQTIVSSRSQKIADGVSSTRYFWVFAIISFLVFLGLYISIQRQWKRNIGQAGASLRQVALGALPEKVDEHQNEIGEVTTNTNAIIDYLHQASDFALKIGEGDFKYKFEPKSENDTLGNALMQMRTRLQEVAREDRVRNWMNEGHARLGDILRASGNDFETLGDNIVSFLVDYMNASMGALYILNVDNDSPQLELLSAYAFNRKKHEERTLNPGEGLAGQAFVERKSIFIKDVKTSHFNIVTGLGESKPASVFIVPLKQEEAIEGVVELAAFRTFEDYEKEFIEKLGETIASAIKGGKDNETTKRLLTESQQKEEEMKAQEEELRQNMEELSATQEQVDRLRKEDETRKKELEEKRETLYEVLNQIPQEVYLKDEKGKYVYVNKPFALSQNRMIEDFIEKTDFDIYSQEIAEQRKLQEKQVMDNGESQEVTLDDVGPDGKNVKKKVRLSPFYINYLQSNGVLAMSAAG